MEGQRITKVEIRKKKYMLSIIYCGIINNSKS